MAIPTLPGERVVHFDPHSRVYTTSRGRTFQMGANGTIRLVSGTGIGGSLPAGSRGGGSVGRPGHPLPPTATGGSHAAPPPTTVGRPGHPLTDVLAGNGGGNVGTGAGHPGGLGGAGGSPGNPYLLPNPIVGHPLQLTGSGGSLLPLGLANAGSPFDPSVAGAYAGAEFDPQILGVQNQLNVIPGQTAQNLHDISSWYQQVLSALDTARQQAGVTGATGSGNMKAVAQGVLGSLGGGGGSNALAGAGADSQALAGQIGSIESNFLSGEAPLLQADAASASTREQARQQAIARDLTNQMLGLQGQKGARQSDLSMQIAEYNNNLTNQQNQNTLGIRQYNNQFLTNQQQQRLNLGEYNNNLAQTQYGNQIGNLTTADVLALTGAQVKYYGQGLGKPGFVPWAQVPAPEKDKMLNNALLTVAPSGALHDWKPPKTFADRQANQMVINRAKQQLVKWFHGRGYTNPQISVMIDTAIRGAVNRARAAAENNQAY